jgi:transglutaminase-like putative cysteine protease
VEAETHVVLSVAVAPTANVTESLSLIASGADHRANEIDGGHATRLHVVHALRAGAVQVDYRATIEGRSTPATVVAADQVRYLRPSRYCESDRLAGFARSEFAGLEGRALLDAVSSWVGTRVAYVSGSSRPIDGAVSTLLAQEGVCRDFAHLVIAILRARSVPARLVSVYAPGLDPMDFHAVAEACIDGEWLVVDATTLAPRAGLVRIATGRDAADTAFLSTLAGSLSLDGMVVTAVVEDGLPDDDITSAVMLG